MRSAEGHREKVVKFTHMLARTAKGHQLKPDKLWQTALQGVPFVQVPALLYIIIS